MKTEVRLLPHLNQLYLQKKSYEVHKKKIQTIKRSSSFAKKSISSSRIFQNEQDSKSHHSHNFDQFKSPESNQSCLKDSILPETHMETIHQGKPGLLYWMRKMNPLQKRIKQEQLKQNKRMREKLKKSTSFITTKGQIEVHNYLFEGMKKRLSKFSSDQNSHKTSLRCQVVYNKINALQKQKLKVQQSRIKLFEKPSRYPFQQKSLSIKQKNSSTYQSKTPQRISQKRTNQINEPANFKNKFNNFTKIRSNGVLTDSKNRPSLLVQSGKDLKTKGNIIRSVPKARNIKTQPSQFGNSNQKFNDSKMSQLSSSSTTPYKPMNEYKILKVNLTEPSERGLRKIPKVKYEYSYNRDKISSMRKQNDVNKLISNRIKTEGGQTNIKPRNGLLKLNSDRNQKLNKFDFQRRRIQRFLTQKNSLVLNEISNPLKSMKNIKASQNLNKSRKPAQQQKVQQNVQVQSDIIQQIMQKADKDIPQQTKDQNIQSLNNCKDEDNGSFGFATQIQ